MTPDLCTCGHMADQHTRQRCTTQHCNCKTYEPERVFPRRLSGATIVGLCLYLGAVVAIAMHF